MSVWWFVVGLLLTGYCCFAGWVLWQLWDWQKEVNMLGRRWEGWP